MVRIKEDIRFYLPADPYYYKVDNLPLEDLLTNDMRLQDQIDVIQAGDSGNTLRREGFLELKPYIDQALPGQVVVNAGNFIGRVQRSSENGLVGFTGEESLNGIFEIMEKPTHTGTGDNPTGTYNVLNNPDHPNGPAKSVGRTSVIEFKGGSVAIDEFDDEGFNMNPAPGAINPAPLGRIDLIGLTTMNGAFDDPYLPGNSGAAGVIEGDGYAKLAVVQGAGITYTDNGLRVKVPGEKYITVGMPANQLNDYGRNLEGEVVPNPQFGTVPSPDDIVNVCFAREDINDSLTKFAYSNKNANFFLPLAYVFVPNTHVQGAPLPTSYLKDIRPFFRTAELSLQERQAIATSVQPSYSNPFTTVTNVSSMFGPITLDLEEQIADLRGVLTSTEVERNYTFGGRRIANINNVRGTRGWTKVSLGDMGFGESTPDGLTAVLVYFFGFIHYPDSGSVNAYVTCADFLPNGTNTGTFYGKVLLGRSAGHGDDIATSNTAVVPVDGDGNFWVHIGNPGFSYGLYADVQGFTTTRPILAE